MKFIQEDPLKLYVTDYTESEMKELEEFLSYKDKSVEYQIKKLRSRPYYSNRNGEDWLTRRIDELKGELKKKVLFSDEKGFYTLSGLVGKLKKRFWNAEFDIKTQRPTIKPIPWDKIPEYELRPYQTDSVVELFKCGHGNVELPTGSGKSSVLLYLARNLGLKTLVVAPSTNIAEQLYKLFVRHLSKKYVGFYGGGKKESNKLITIGIAQSITRIEKDSEAWNDLSKCDAFAFDETHLIAADTFFSIATGIASGAWWRFFVSATPERNDGKDLLLEGIIGDTIVRKDIQNLIQEGYLAKLSTMIIDIESASTVMTDNTLKMNQEHLYQNRKIVDFIVQASYQAFMSNMPTLILIDEHQQEQLLKAYMKIPYEYASGDSDVSRIVEDFNSGKIMCVVGTSAVSVGTDFLPLRLTIAWQGNRASTKVKQGPIGRSTRIDKRTGKTDCKIIDFRVTNIPILKRHSNARIKEYEAVGPVTYVKI